MRLAFLVFIILSCNLSIGQSVCPNPGQNPSTAFPVCGTSTFTQNTVPLCPGRLLPSPACTSDPLKDVNPYWYKFTCFQAGTLGFLITPKDLGDDYDWELCDVTGKDPDLIYNDANLVIASNWSGEPGVTGASNSGSKQYVCAGYGQPLFSKMPVLQLNHNYLLLISHFTQSQSGYDLSFTGGSAVITDTTPPKMKMATSFCGGQTIRLKLNKKMKCFSVAADGSDFFITPGNIPVSNATGIGCTNGFDLDSVEIHIAAPLAPGNYSLNIKNGSDGNTIKDVCDNSIPSGDKVDFEVFPLLPVPMDSIEPVKCAPRQLWLHFSRPIDCSTVASDGSDFIISGPFNVTISKVYGNCNSTQVSSNEIVLNLTAPLNQNGTFTITLKQGTDGNTIKDECGLETPAGSNISFEAKQAVDAAFTYEVRYGCTMDSIFVAHDGQGFVTKWTWNLDDNQTSSSQTAVGIYNQFTSKKISLSVTNGLCSDTSSQIVSLDNYLHADFISLEDNCPKEPVTFTSNAQGKIAAYAWSFGDGTTSSEQSPVHIYSQPLTTSSFTVRFSVTDSFNCTNTKQKIITVYSSCFLAVPTAFTPNNDGKNDFLNPLNAIKATELDFKVFNRWGQLIFETKDWKHGWDGNFQGKPQPSGVYIWFLHYRDRDNGKISETKGTSLLIR